MRISGSDPNTPGLNLLGSMSKVGERQSNLIFVYPLLFDKVLIKKWEMLLRDFLTAQFISQIKISNVLNITQSAVQGYGHESGVPYLNPAEILNQALSNNRAEFTNALQSQLTAIQAQQFNNTNQNKISNTEYAYKLQELRQFIKQQVLTDPIYDGLRPAFSIISMENSLLDVPLIVGTKSYKIDSSALYWILFVSLLNNRDLTLRTFSDIEELLNNLPKNRFLEIVTSSGLAPPITGSGKFDAIYNQLRTDTNISVKRALDTFKKVATTVNEFENDVGFSISISSNAVQYTQVMADSLAEKAEMQSKIIALVNQTIVSSIFPVIQTINNLIVNPALETNYMERYKRLLAKILDKVTPLINDFIGLYSNRFSQGDTQQAFMKSLESNCKSLQQIKSYDLLARLDNIRLRFTTIRNDVNWNAGTNSRVIDFAEELTRVASSLGAETQTLVKMVENFTGNGQINTLYKDLTQTIQRFIMEYYSESNPANFNPNQQTDLGQPIIANNPNQEISAFFRSIFAGANRNDLLRFLTNSAQALAETTSFLLFYSTFSYFCEFISIIKSKIEIKSKDVIEFPNYTLVIPIEFVKTLYYALAAKNTNDLLKVMNSSQNTEEYNNRVATITNNVNFKLSETEIFRIVSAIIDRLNVKNIIIIDSDKKEIYYQWSYLKRPIKLNESTLINYIRSQSNITAAF